MRGISSVYGLVLLCLVCTSPLQAQEIVDGSDVTTIFQISKGFGSSEMDTDSRGDPMIRGRIEGVKYAILFYGCDSKHNNCRDVQFAASWAGDNFSHSKANKWNNDHRVGRCYISDEGSAIIDYWINLRHGITKDTLEDSFDWWRVTLKEFAAFLE